MTRLDRLAAIHPHAAENSAWDAFFSGAAMSWLTGEREVNEAQEARQHIEPADDEDKRYDLLAAEWDAHLPWLTRIAAAVLAALVLGAVW